MSESAQEMEALQPGFSDVDDTLLAKEEDEFFKTASKCNVIVVFQW